MRVCCCCRFCVLAKCVLHLDIGIAPQPGKSPQKGKTPSRRQQQWQDCQVVTKKKQQSHKGTAGRWKKVTGHMLIPLNLRGTGIIPKVKLPWTYPWSISRVHKLSNWSHLEDHCRLAKTPEKVWSWKGWKVFLLPFGRTTSASFLSFANWQKMWLNQTSKFHAPVRSSTVRLFGVKTQQLLHHDEPLRK